MVILKWCRYAATLFDANYRIVSVNWGLTTDSHLTIPNMNWNTQFGCSVYIEYCVTLAVNRSDKISHRLYLQKQDIEKAKYKDPFWSTMQFIIWWLPHVYPAYNFNYSLTCLTEDVFAVNSMVHLYQLQSLPHHIESGKVKYSSM